MTIRTRVLNLRAGRDGRSVEALKPVSFRTLGSAKACQLMMPDGCTACTRWGARPVHKAFNRACKRANQAINAGTWYRGRWHGRQTLDSLRNSTIDPSARRARATRPARSRPAPNFSIFVWNTEGFLQGCFRNSWPGVKRRHSMT